LQLFEADIGKAVGVSAEAFRGLPQIVPLLVVVFVASLRGNTRSKRGEVTQRLPLPGSGRVSPTLPLFLIPVAVFVLFVPKDWADAFVMTFVTGILLLSVVLISGYTGQLSLAQLALGGFGAWVAARLAENGMVFELALLIGVAATTVVGLVIALPALRTRGVTLAVVTLALAQVLKSLIFDSSPATGGIDGLRVKPPSIFGIEVNPITHPERYAVFALVLLALLGLVVANIRRGVVGRRLIAVRSNERAAASVGVSVLGAKLYSFAVAAAIASVGGTILAFRSTSVTFSRFDVFGSIELVLYGVLGGIGWLGGAAIGATMAAGALAERAIRIIFGSVDNVDYWLLIVFGLSVVGMLRQSADGAADVVARNVRAVRSLVQRHRAQDAVPSPSRRPKVLAPGIDREPVSIEARGITVRFGGVEALNDVSFELHPGEVLGLIGPNGAGKTAMLDVLTGFSRPTAGMVLLDGVSALGWSPERFARAGIVRSWQGVELFQELTVHENLLVATDRHHKARYLTDLIRPGRPAETRMMYDVVERLGLTPYLDSRPSALSHGVSRLVGIARAMSAEPAALLLDEPAAGLDVHESAELGGTIRQIAVDHGIPILVVEHDIPMLMNLCDRIVVLDFGRLIAIGVPAEIATNPDVIRAYLGVGDTAPGGKSEVTGTAVGL
jgi:sulfate-transporting ATPase